MHLHRARKTDQFAPTRLAVLLKTQSTPGAESSSWCRTLWKYACACVVHDIRMESGMKKWVELARLAWFRKRYHTYTCTHEKQLSVCAFPSVDPFLLVASWFRYCSLYSNTLRFKRITTRELTVVHVWDTISEEDKWELFEIEMRIPTPTVVFFRSIACAMAYAERLKTRRCVLMYVHLVHVPTTGNTVTLHWV
jgi:hypothetical protein